MTQIDSNIKRGSAELAVLTLLSQATMHGYEIAQRIERQTGGLLTFDLASLYPLLYRLEKRGWLKCAWETAASGRKRRYYRITAVGRKQLAPLRNQWRLFFVALNRLAGVRSA